MKFSYKIFKTDNGVLLAIADFSILGKKYSEGEVQIEVRRDFYSGEICDEKNALKLVRHSSVINAVGNDIISILIKNKIIEETNILYIKGMPHAQIITFE